MSSGETRQSLIRVAVAAIVALSGGACGILSSSPSPSPTPIISGGNVGPFAFAYPSAWTIEIAGAPQSYRTVFGFLVSPPATATESCAPDGTCAEQVSVPDGTVVITMAGWAQPECNPDAATTVSNYVASGWVAQTIGGLPAAYDNAATDAAGFTRMWEIAGPATGDCTVYELKARFGPSATELAADVDALVSTLQIRMPGV